MVKNGISEHEIQKELISLVDQASNYYKELHLLFAIPNGGSRGGNKLQRTINGRKMKLEGVRKGVPDLFLPVPKNKHHGLFIEMKKPRAYASPEQKQWLEDLESQGYMCAICKSSKEAFDTICNYLGIKVRALCEDAIDQE